MVQKMTNFIKKNWDILTYLFFGGLTTLVNLVISIPCNSLFLAMEVPCAATISNLIAWTGAVSFAFFTNKPFVFHSHDWSAAVVIPELTRFLSCRIGSGVLELLIPFVFVDLLKGSFLFWKLASQIIVVILNYIASKLLVFKKK